MKRFIILSTALALLALPALAQSSSSSGSVTPDVPAAPDEATTGALPPPDLEQALSALRDSRASANVIGDMKAVNTVRFIKLEDLMPGERKAELDTVLEESIDDQTGLQAAIKSNSVLAQKLEDENIDVSAIAAGRVEADGSVTLYVR